MSDNRKTRESNSCRTCKWGEQPGPNFVFCHRHAPDVEAPSKYRPGRNTPTWPNTGPHGWCGDWEAKVLDEEVDPWDE